MIFPPNYEPPNTSATTAEEAEQRLLELLRRYSQTPRASKPSDPGMVNMLGQMNIWTNVMQAGVGLAYMEVTGKPVPDEYAVSKETMSLWGEA